MNECLPEEGKRRLKRWTAMETHLLRKTYGRRPVSAIARYLGRSVYSVMCCAFRLGLLRERVRSITDDNRARIADHYRTHTAEETAAAFGMSATTVRRAARQSGFRKLHAGEEWEREVIETHKALGMEGACAKLGVGRPSIRRILRRHGLVKSKRPPLNDEQKKWILANYPAVSRGFCAMFLGVSPKMVYDFLRGQGLVEPARKKESKKN